MLLPSNYMYLEKQKSKSHPLSFTIQVGGTIIMQGIKYTTEYNPAGLYCKFNNLYNLGGHSSLYIV